MQHHLDDYDTIRVVNFIRREVAAGMDPLPVLAGQHTTPPWAADEFLAPVLPDDPLITYDYEQEGDRWGRVPLYSGAADVWPCHL